MNTGEMVLNHIQAMGLKQWRPKGNGWRGTSPLRHGADGDTFVLMIDPDGESGGWYDHKDGTKGSLYELARQFGIEPAGSGNGSTTSKKGYKSLKDYAIAHALTEEILMGEPYKWVEGEVFDSGRNRPALSYQVRMPDGKIETRHRFIDGVEGLKRYKSEGDHPGTWYMLSYAVKMAKDKGLPLMIVGGEIGSIAGIEHGIPTCATTQGEKANGLDPKLLALLKTYWDGDIWVLCDADDAGRQYGASIAKQWGVDKTTCVLLEKRMGNNQDIADFCKLFGDDTLSELQTMVKSGSVLSISEIIGGGIIVTIQDVAPALREQFLERNHLYNSDPLYDGITGLHTGFKTLDKHTGGLGGGQVHVILGATGMGKSTLTASLVSNLMMEADGYIETTEMNIKEYTMKLVSAVSRVPYDVIETGIATSPQKRLILEAFEYVAAMRTVMAPFQRSTPEQLAERVKKAVDMGAKYWVIDSINKLKRSLTVPSYQAMTAASDAIMEIAGELNIPVIVTSQIGRKDVGSNGELKPTPPHIHSARDAGGIEEDAHGVWGLYNYWYYVQQGVAQENLLEYPKDTAWLYNRKLRSRAQMKPLLLDFVSGCYLKESENQPMKAEIVHDDKGNFSLDVSAL